MMFLLTGLGTVVLSLLSVVWTFPLPVVSNIPTHGPYHVGTKQYNVSILDRSYPVLHVIWPDNGPHGMKFPLLSYAHGAAGGDWYSIEGYYSLWTQMASHGFVIVAPASCSLGCKNGGWSTYYLEQLKCIDWARNQSEKDPILSMIDWSMGVGIVGHSMGGQATVRSAKETYTRPRNITAAVLHHPEVDNGGRNISVPLAAFTGTTDHICPAEETFKIWDPAPPPKLIRNEIGWDHLEPVLTPPIENPMLATYTAAWFKIYINGDTDVYYSLIYNTSNPDSLCNSAPMANCTSVK
eukprot:m.572835 g.572835  ORF g.572835 m.572835 type:complete len:295 (-) comp22274_c1_seq1:793-1677(-)